MFSEQLLTIDELRDRMRALRAREANLRSQIDALQTQAADRQAYLTLADDLQGFLAQPHRTADTPSANASCGCWSRTSSSARTRIIIRHRIPIRARTGDANPDTAGEPTPDLPIALGASASPLVVGQNRCQSGMTTIAEPPPRRVA